MDIAVAVTVTGNTITINYEDNMYTDIPQVQLTGISSASTQIVIFGERNFTFTTALASLRGGLWKGITATTTTSPSLATFSTAKDLSKVYSVKNACFMYPDSAPTQDEIWHRASRLKLLDDPPPNAWQYGVDVTDNDIEVKDKVAWLQCPWIPLHDRTLDYNIGNMITCFMKDMNTKQVKGDYLLLGIVNKYPYITGYMLKKVLHNALHGDHSASVHGYAFLGGDVDLIKEILQHGYKHETVQGSKDIHFYIINCHLTLVFQKL